MFGGAAGPADEGPESQERPTSKAKRSRRTGLLPDKCQVKDCTGELELPYHKKYHVCGTCFRTESIFIDGALQRFCQCGRFQLLADFEGVKRTCQHALEQHNARRRAQKARLLAAGSSASDEPGAHSAGGSGARGDPPSAAVAMAGSVSQAPPAAHTPAAAPLLPAPSAPDELLGGTQQGVPASDSVQALGAASTQGAATTGPAAAGGTAGSAAVAAATAAQSPAPPLPTAGQVPLPLPNLNGAPAASHQQHQQPLQTSLAAGLRAAGQPGGLLDLLPTQGLQNLRTVLGSARSATDGGAGSSSNHDLAQLVASLSAQINERLGGRQPLPQAQPPLPLLHHQQQQQDQGASAFRMATLALQRASAAVGLSNANSLSNQLDPLLHWHEQQQPPQQQQLQLPSLSFTAAAGAAPLSAGGLPPFGLAASATLGFRPVPLPGGGMQGTAAGLQATTPGDPWKLSVPACPSVLPATATSPAPLPAASMQVELTAAAAYLRATAAVSAAHLTGLAVECSAADGTGGSPELGLAALPAAAAGQALPPAVVPAQYSQQQIEEVLQQVLQAVLSAPAAAGPGSSNQLNGSLPGSS
ncbi:Squamosa promoter-binding-like protein 9 [Chlorella vulgaris]